MEHPIIRAEDSGVPSKTIIKLPTKRKPMKLLNVAAYARVSTAKDAMQHSLAAQVSYYSELIQKHPGWRFSGVYADEAMTGTKDTREQFQRLLRDCREGRINMVITKAISRFARNTVTSLETIRELRAIGVDVYFEEQNIHSMSGEGELLLTILSAFAQEESHSASENMKWRIRKAFENGDLMNMRTMLGYQITKENGIQVDPEQAALVREMYSRFLGGESLNGIAKWLNQHHYTGAFDGKWQPVRVRDVLANEKYTGNSLLQKEYRNNHIEKKRMRNRGELPQYYATETHPPVIDEATYNAAQLELKRIAEKNQASKPGPRSALSGKIVCAGCGKHYKRTKNHGRARWVCSTYYTKGKSACQSKQIPEEEIIRLGCEVLGLEDFDAETVDHITAIYPYTMVFHLADGREERREWHSASRSESWTPEMKVKAAEDAQKKGRT